MEKRKTERNIDRYIEISEKLSIGATQVLTIVGLLDETGTDVLVAESKEPRNFPPGREARLSNAASSRETGVRAQSNKRVKREATERQHQLISDGTCMTNRIGVSVCKAFREGNCEK